MEQYRKGSSKQFNKKDEVHSMLHTMFLSDNYDGAIILDHIWHGAEAYHLYLLALRQLYSGYKDESLKTVISIGNYCFNYVLSFIYTQSLLLKGYHDVLSPQLVYSLLVVTSHVCKFYSICSQV